MPDTQSAFHDYFFQETVVPCARSGCEKPAAIRVNDSFSLCGKHYKEHTRL